MFRCRFCECADARRALRAREMLLGWREEFEYRECADCGSLQISEIPADLGRYYPSQYHTLSSGRSNAFQRWTRRLRFRHAWPRTTAIGHLLAATVGAPYFVAWLAQLPVRRSDPILDAGCGGGRLLLHMHDVGFTDLTGVDAYIAQTIDPAPGLRIRKGTLDGLDRRFKLVMFHHSLEHFRSPADELRHAARLLDEGGRVLIRLPIAGSYACRQYGKDWVALDPPRHLAIPSVKGMHILAHRLGYEVDAVLFDSQAMQFWASEQYQRDIPLMDPRSYLQTRKHSAFTHQQIRAFHARAAELNRSGDGDAACFFLRR